MKALKHDFEITEEMKLPEPFKTNWLKDLRSGEYKQGQCSLFNNGKYCCLGIAGKTAGYSDKRLLNKNGSTMGIISKRDNYFIKLTKVPIQLQGDNELTAFLITSNDSEYTTHKEIANWIEKYL